MKIRLHDSNFAHLPSGSSASSFPGNNLIPKYIEWIRDEKTECKISVFTDDCLHQVNDNPPLTNIAWLMEPRILYPSIYEEILKYQHKFDLILTHDKQLMLELDNKNFECVPLAGSWIKYEDYKIYDKTKNISMITSGKIQTPLHKFRHEIISKYGYKLDGIFGTGYSAIDYKLDGLKDFKFQIVVENDQNDFWWTEKISDCFATGTIPIYKGCPSIGKWFDIDGILTFDTIEDLEKIIDNNVNDYFYSNSMNSIRNNFEEIKKYRVIEDYMFNKFLYKYD